MGIVETAGIFLLDDKFNLMVGHPTGHDIWSIPKGKLEEHETSFQAALRETWEEMNVELEFTTDKYHELDMVRYKHGKKKLKPFVIFSDENIGINPKRFVFKCNSIVGPDSSWNVGLPEMDDFKWVTLDEAREILHYTQVTCIDKIIEIIESRNGETSK